ncbi:hypothetical protein E4T43_06127 [Aureobasidium subglaciale]|nr:hypothetical protein E4T43_06127 [Aureobasidium subglaciale]
MSKFIAPRTVICGNCMPGPLTSDTEDSDSDRDSEYSTFGFSDFGYSGPHQRDDDYCGPNNSEFEDTYSSDSDEDEEAVKCACRSIRVSIYDNFRHKSKTEVVTTPWQTQLLNHPPETGLNTLVLHNGKLYTVKWAGNWKKLGTAYWPRGFRDFDSASTAHYVSIEISISDTLSKVLTTTTMIAKDTEAMVRCCHIGNVPVVKIANPMRKDARRQIAFQVDVLKALDAERRAAVPEIPKFDVTKLLYDEEGVYGYRRELGFVRQMYELGKLAQADLAN